jgi:hemerythrin
VADLITWKPEFSVGVVAFDMQHKRLIAMLNDLHAAMGRGEAQNILAHLFGELVDYTKTHFQAEERLMERHSFPNLMKHRAEHNELTDRATELQKQFQAGNATVSVALLGFLRDWLKHHILDTDKQYEHFFVSRGEAPVL